MKYKLLIIAILCILQIHSKAQDVYLFRDTTLTDEVRINNLLSLLTLDEKISLLSTDLGIPRFGIPHCGHFEGLHGLALGGPAMWGGRKKK